MWGLKALWHKLGSPRWFYEMTPRWVTGLRAVGLLTIAAGSVWGLAFSPPDYQQGDTVRIMYLHVPAAILAEHCYMLMGVAGIVLLVWRMKLADMVIAQAAPIGAAFTVLALITGSLWGHPTWGTWWVWDARTTSVVVLLFLYVGIIALRGAILREETAARACAVLAIVGMIDIPIIKYSVDWWLTLHQTATFKITEKPAMPASMWLPLLLNVLGFYALFAAVLLSGVRNEVLVRERRTQWVREVVAENVG